MKREELRDNFIMIRIWIWDIFLGSDSDPVFREGWIRILFYTRVNYPGTATHLLPDILPVENNARKSNHKVDIYGLVSVLTRRRLQ